MENSVSAAKTPFYSVLNVAQVVRGHRGATQSPILATPKTTRRRGTPMIDTARLAAALAPYGIQLTESQLEALRHYATELVEWNQKINLTAITAPQEMETKHFLDSLLLANQGEVAGRLVDVGSGAGFPGVVAKVYKPALAATLMEPTGKRVQFLQHLAGALGVEADVVKERAEEAARKQWRESFDVATARAVAALPALCEYCLPLVKPGGTFLAMKGGEVDAELATAQNAITKLGGKLLRTQCYTLPDGAKRAIVVVQKVAATPPQYPRNGGVIAKRPL